MGAPEIRIPKGGFHLGESEIGMLMDGFHLCASRIEGATGGFRLRKDGFVVAACRFACLPPEFACVPPQFSPDSEEPGFLELIADTESGICEIGQTASTGASILAEIARIIEDGTSRINNLPATGNYSAAKLAAANRVAASLDDPAVRLSMIAQEYGKHVERASPGMVYMLDQLINNPEQLKQAGDFPKQIGSLVSVARDSAANAVRFVSSMQGSGNATRSMRRVTDSICKSSSKIADASNKIASWQSMLDRIGV